MTTNSTLDKGEALAKLTLAHFGVKGMKWGVRNDRGHEGERAKTKKIAKLDKKFEKEAGSFRNTVAIHNSAADKFNAKIDALNNKPEYKDADFTRLSPLRTQYENEVQRMFLDNLHAAAKELGTNASGTKEYGIMEHDDSWDVFVKEVKHAATRVPLDVEMKIKLTKNAKGHITKVTVVEPAQNGISHDMTVEDIIAHYGVKGMRWGVRKDRPAQDITIYTRNGKKPIARGGKRAANTKDALDTVATRQKSKHSTTHALTNKELEDAVKRMRLEQQYNKLTGENLSVGRKFLNALIDTYGELKLDEID